MDLSKWPESPLLWLGTRRWHLCEPRAPKREDDQIFLLDLKWVGQGEWPFLIASLSFRGHRSSPSALRYPQLLLVKRLGGVAAEGTEGRKTSAAEHFPEQGGAGISWIPIQLQLPEH